MLKSFAKCDSAAKLTASYDVALTLAKKGKAFRDGEVAKECAIKMALAFRAKELAGNFQKVSLSHQTVARRVKDLSDNVTSQLHDNVKNRKYFSLSLNESTDVSDISQLLVCIRTIDENFTVCEELLKTCPLYRSAQGIDILALMNDPTPW